ncbi:hypothetical protein PAMC26577_26340 [Caballeronia sordidicola]|uniref:Uncharacterized protein n=1 Tax=Caballeronia sordidicola TaxID=196367 RepID=A0A242MHE5_CABSO|nr:hypothetical protein PAMC26577_26340 [Caballeronia sordidicola]
MQLLRYGFHVGFLKSVVQEKHLSPLAYSIALSRARINWNENSMFNSGEIFVALA